MQGKLIVIDGTDGSGKGTQTKVLVERLEQEGRAVAFFDFPQYGTKSAGPVEEYLHGKYGSAHEVGPYKASVLFAVDRFDASFRIRAALAKGKVCIANRYTTSNMGHQAGLITDVAERETYLQWLHDFEYGLLGIPQPDAVIFLFADAEMARQKALRVNKTNIDKTKDITENDAEYMQKGAAGYLYVAKKYQRDVVDCNDGNGGMRSIEAIHADVWEIVTEGIQ